jgi:hypothetical protein
MLVLQLSCLAKYKVPYRKRVYTIGSMAPKSMREHKRVIHVIALVQMCNANIICAQGLMNGLPAGYHTLCIPLLTCNSSGKQWLAPGGPVYICVLSNFF